MGSTPAPGVATWRPRRVAATLVKSLNGEYVRAVRNVTGGGASHGAQGGRAPLSLNHYGLAVLSAACGRHFPRLAQVELAGAEAGQGVEVEELVRVRLPQVWQVALGQLLQAGSQRPRRAVWCKRIELTPSVGCAGMTTDTRLKREKP